MHALILRPLKFLLKTLIFFGFFSFFILNLSVVSLLAQQVIVSETNFNPNVANISSGYFAINNVNSVGIQGGILTSSTPLFGGNVLTTFRDQFNYVIAKNPVLINPNYISAPDDYMFIVTNNIGSQANVITYTVNNLVPNSPVIVTVAYQNIIDPTSSLALPPYNCQYNANNLLGIINPVSTETGTSLGRVQLKPGESTLANLIGTVDSLGKMVFKINTLASQPCVDFGITSIIVKGSPQPAFIKKPEEELCAGEFLIFEAANKFQGTYQWFEDGNPISGETGSSLTFQSSVIPGNHKYKYNVNLTNPAITLSSPEVSVSTIKCCEGPNGSPSSRTTIFYDDFGTLVDPLGKAFKVWDYTTSPSKPIQKIIPADAPFRLKIMPEPLETSFEERGPITDFKYAVVANMTTSNLSWSNNILGYQIPSIGYDHSGKAEGAALLINVPNVKGPLYTREFKNLCVNNGDKIFFECYITVFTCEPNGVDISITLDGGGVIEVHNGVANSGCRTGEPTIINAGVWVPIRAQVQLLPPYTLKLSIDNNSASNQNGNDLVIDDIRLMACTPPEPLLYFNTFNNSQTSTCDSVSFTASIDKNINLYYGNSTYNLIQWTKNPNDVGSWKNIEVVQADTNWRIKNVRSLGIFNTIDSIYFRTITGTLPVLTSPPANGFNINDACRNYSVSKASKINLNCGNITGISSKEKEEALLYPNPGKDIITFQGKANSFSVYNHLGILVAKSDNSNFNINSLEKGIYHVIVTDVNGKTYSQKLVKE